MILICQRYFGSIARCNKCGAVIGYNPNDVFANKKINCPQCGLMIEVPFDPNYDGIVKEEESNT